MLEFDANCYYSFEPKKINNNNLIMRLLHILTWSTITLARTYSLAKGYGTANS